jgi:hypothetical protein
LLHPAHLDYQVAVARTSPHELLTVIVESRNATLPPASYPPGG